MEPQHGNLCYVIRVDQLQPCTTTNRGEPSQQGAGFLLAILHTPAFCQSTQCIVDRNIENIRW